jgi:hypothetical protein
MYNTTSMFWGVGRWEREGRRGREREGEGGRGREGEGGRAGE